MLKILNKTLLASALLLLNACGSGSESSDSSALGITYSGTGQSGSLASMTILNGQLHVIDQSQIKSYSLEEPMAPAKIEYPEITWVNRAETLFNYNNEYLMIGTEFGVVVLQTSESQEQNFEFVSEFTHVRAYDPVIAYNGLAYYTTRNGSDTHSGATDILGLLDISNIESPLQIDEYGELIEPYGLALHNDELYVCDAGESLTKFIFIQVPVTTDSVDANGNPIQSDETQPAFERQELNISQPCYDVIALANHLILTTADGIFQYEIHETGLREMSHILRQN